MSCTDLTTDLASKPGTQLLHLWQAVFTARQAGVVLRSLETKPRADAQSLVWSRASAGGSTSEQVISGPSPRVLDEDKDSTRQVDVPCQASIPLFVKIASVDLGPGALIHIMETL